MHRKKPTSTRQKKAEQQLRRAIKRGDAPPPDPKPHRPKTRSKAKLGPTGLPIGAPTNAAGLSSRKLQSRFVTLPPKYLEETKSLASSLDLQRPIPDDATLFEVHSSEGLSALTCPRRPKWRFDMTKKEVEANEEGLFKKWLEQTDDSVRQWREISVPSQAMPRSPTYFERNLEVWRQLWRVTEISQIILVLLDSRAPLVHYPPSLRAYLTGKSVILVLTKVDISGPARTEAWIRYLQELSPETPIVQVESYIVKETSDHQGKKQYEPHIPLSFRERLVETIQEVHARMLEPPERIKSHPERLANWKPPVKRDIDWAAVLKAQGDRVGTAVGGPAIPRSTESETGEEENESNLEYLTIGLIGQPNVGKSSLLNALFGTQKVRASKTPGKTKHFQTLFWTRDVRLVDCPGLVMPNYTPLETQVLCGILPISNVSAVPACIYHAAQLIPLEKVFNLTHPPDVQSEINAKRTWRDGMKPSSNPETATSAERHWTAMDILTAYADMKGWVTAKAGRPDVHRAGNAILRFLAEGKISWTYWPPGTVSSQISAHAEAGTGIWIPKKDGNEEISDEDSEDEHEQEEGKGKVESLEDSEEEEDEEDDESEGIENAPSSSRVSTTSRFAALALQEEDEEEDQSEEGEDE